LRSNRTLSCLSLNNCQLGKDLMKAIGKGLMCNDKLDTLLLRGNNLEEESILELVDALESNRDLKLKVLDLSSNRLNVNISQCCNILIFRINVESS